MYCTLDDLKKAIDEGWLAELAGDKAGDTLAGPKAKLNLESAISAACQEIDGYLAGRYQVPFAAPYPLRLRNLSARIAVYVLHRRKHNSEWDKDYERCQRSLERLASGADSLTPKAEALPSPESATVITVISPERIFSPAVMEGY